MGVFRKASFNTRLFIVFGPCPRSQQPDAELSFKVTHKAEKLLPSFTFGTDLIRDNPVILSAPYLDEHSCRIRVTPTGIGFELSSNQLLDTKVRARVLQSIAAGIR